MKGLNYIKKEPTFNRLEGGLEVGIIGQKLCEPYNYWQGVSRMGGTEEIALGYLTTKIFPLKL
jgi:hypothetical protein